MSRNSLMPRNSPVKSLGNSSLKESGNSPALPKKSGNAAAASSSVTSPPKKLAVITSNNANNANKSKAISKEFYNNLQGINYIV
ncbi:hypothetical protein F8M41_000371 [Gigaspora margarita]|uniref:Uncharacterized protein n=1 Tax=Gigaspora margarita TaxID=4874 RepID=A0A8H3XGZ2_GIGMA|nr:hypothetical protein F8M41_000371 [Gigaspora margarita]